MNQPITRGLRVDLPRAGGSTRSSVEAQIGRDRTRMR